ncbi:ABC transporter ATP-binding protein [Spirochaeta isovalerica]|uniref:ABC-2 type transport system ATP-binding protein n=1 Tax=Spirochaeta isovalerica TaxID=150 RepID=A0A841R8U6_9SPIO|nr:ABC transporter ATP-binding protein [Spirochaeta isovalerica]MBB6479379.1 ABC-2 type transport system ATP-binding protein [Spirochaeta isovalerica]
MSVEVAGLTKMFGDFAAVDHVSFSVEKGEIFGFLGANGAGKTTTIRMLCGLLEPSEGTGRVAGFDINREYNKIKNRIGYMSQKFSLYNDLTAWENIEFYGGIYGLNDKEIKERSSELFAIIGLEELKDKLTSSIPMGWKQRLALCASLLHDPDIIFLDEPTSGVDPVSRRNFWKLIYQLSDMGKTVFVTTHYMDEAEYCHRLSIMKQGRIIEMDNPRSLKEKYGVKTMQDVFLASVGRGEN